MATALGSTAVERTTNVIDNLLNRLSDTPQLLRIVDKFAEHNEAELLDWLEGQARPRDLGELTNTEKAVNFLTIMTNAGKAVLRKVAEDNETVTVADQIVAAGDIAEGDLTE